LSHKKQNKINVFLGLFKGAMNNLRVKAVLSERLSFEGMN
jgi:hypothetical protein